MKKHRIFIRTNYSLLLGLTLILSGCNLKREKETDSPVLTSSSSKSSKTENSQTKPEKVNGWTTFTTKDGIAFNHVVGIAVDTDNVKWIGTANGVSSYDEK